MDRRGFFGLFISLLFIGCENKKLYESNNKELKALDFEPNRMIDPYCKMFVTQKKYSAQAILADGKTYFFDDIGCLIMWSEANKPVKMYVYTLDTNEFIDAKEAFYSRTEEDTPMHHGFGAYKYKRDGLIDFESVRVYMLRGEDLTNPAIKRALLGK